MTKHEAMDIPTRCADGSLNTHGMAALDLYRDAMDARRCARVYADKAGRVNRIWATRARFYFHLFRVHLERARELAS